jgi:hypothetical protein
MIYTGKTISFQANGKFHTANSSHPEFTKIVDLCKAKKFDDASKLLDVKAVIAQALAGTQAAIVGHQVVYKGKPVNGVLAQRILELRREGFPVEPLLRFLDNLMLNPSLRATEELYGFLEASKLPITDDGHFLAYKSVRQDFKDHHTGTMDNSVGTVVKMDRNQVDEDKDRTCSRGLHFAAHEYASGFGSGGRMVVLKINPRDVVAIPSDYNNQKGRACEYLVLEEVQREDTKLVGAKIVPTAPVVPVAPAAPKKQWEPKFPVGTKVRIAKTSEYYTRKHKYNPQDTDGVVVMVPRTSTVPHGYRVDWPEGTNTYNESDLELAPVVFTVPVVPPVRLKVGDKVVLSAKGRSEYMDRLWNPHGKVGTVIEAKVGHDFIYRVEWPYLTEGRSNNYREGELELSKVPTYTPEADNYKDTSRWNTCVTQISTFIGKAEQFPVNRDVPYILERKSNKKVYSGEFYFTAYNRNTGALVFQRFGRDGKVDRYVTITNVADWFIQVDMQRN